MDAAALLEHREAKDDFFRHDPHSPLEHTDRHHFDGLDYYEPDPAYVFTVPMEPGDLSVLRIPTSDQREKVYKRAGKVRLEVEGTPVELTVFDTGHPGYFLPFRDETSGNETYGAGRYLDIERNQDGTLTIDFNYAYNPSCVYSDAYSCPLPPPENWLQIPIEAGEKMWERG